MTDLENIVAKGYRTLENAWRAWQPQRSDTGALSTVKDTGRSLPGLIDDLIAGGMVGSFGGVVDPRLGQSPDTRAAKQKVAKKKFVKDAAINAAAAGAGFGVGRGVAKLGEVVGAKALSKISEVGVHHSPIPDIVDAIKVSGKGGNTAFDQVPGYSYFWSPKGKQGATDVAREANYQLDRMWNNALPEDYWRKSAYVTKVPSKIVESDPNLPDSIARRAFGQQSIVNKVVQPLGQNPYASGLNEESLRDMILKAMREVESKNRRLKTVAKVARSVGGR